MTLPAMLWHVLDSACWQVTKAEVYSVKCLLWHEVQWLSCSLVSVVRLVSAAALKRQGQQHVVGHAGS